MAAPKYPGVEESHKYGPVTERKQAPKGINVPIYVQDGENKYSHVPEKQPGELIQQAPVYRGVESKNVYAPSEEKVVNQALLIGPCYPNVEHDSKYIPETKRVDPQIVMAGPKFRGVADTSLYNETPMRAPIEGDRLMTAPIFPGIEANNKYGPTEPPLAPTEKIPSNIPMSTPKYPGVESKNKYNLEELENGFPEKAGPGGAPPMTAPKYQGVEESHKYGPVTERKQAPKGINVPIYVQDGENKYSHVPEKQPGELIQQAPVYG